MPRKRTGTLVWRKSGWFGRYWATVDGELIRVWVDLHTTNRTVAARRLARLVEGGAPPTSSDELVSTFVDEWIKGRGEMGMPCARYERTYWDGFCSKAIGHLQLKDVRPHHL